MTVLSDGLREVDGNTLVWRSLQIRSPAASHGVGVVGDGLVNPREGVSLLSMPLVSCKEGGV